MGNALNKISRGGAIQLIKNTNNCRVEIFTGKIE